MKLSSLITNRSFFKDAVQETASKIVNETLSKRQEIIEKDAEAVQLRSLNDRSYFDNESQYSTQNKELFLKTYEQYVWIYSCVYAIASSGSKVPLKLYQLNPDQTRGDEILEGRLWDLFNRPNPFQSQYDLIESTLSSMELTGDAYLEKGGLTSLEPTQLYCLRPDWMEIVPDAKQLVREYRYTPNGRQIIFTPEEIIHMKYYHPRSELYGCSPIQAANNSLILDCYMIKYQKLFFKQGATINSYISVPGKLSDKEFERLKHQAAAETAGIDNAHKMQVLDNGGELKNNTADPKSLMLTDQRVQNRDEVLAAFGVPPVMLSLLDNATFNNSAEQKKAFWENTMTPKLKKLADKFNMTLCWDFGCEVEFDLSGVEALQEDEAKKSTYLAAYKNAGIMTPNECRAKINRPPLPGGDVLAGASQVPVMAMASQPTLPAAAVKAPEVLKREELLKDLTSQQESITTLYRKSLDPLFKQMSRSVGQIIKDNYKPDEIQKANTDISVKVDAALTESTKALMEKISKMNQATVKEQFKKSYSSVVTQPDNKVLNANISSSVEKNIAKWAKESADSVVKTAQDQMTTLIKDSIENKTPLNEVTAKVQEIFIGTAREGSSMAERIARTETSKAVNMGKMEGYKAGGVTHKEWVSGGGANGRPSHNAIDGQKVPLDKKFSNNMLFPGDPAADVSELVNCRCSVIQASE